MDKVDAGTGFVGPLITTVCLIYMIFSAMDEISKIRLRLSAIEQRLEKTK